MSNKRAEPRVCYQFIILVRFLCKQSLLVIFYIILLIHHVFQLLISKYIKTVQIIQDQTEITVELLCYIKLFQWKTCVHRLKYFLDNYCNCKYISGLLFNRPCLYSWSILLINILIWIIPIYRIEKFIKSPVSKCHKVFQISIFSK